MNHLRMAVKKIVGYPIVALFVLGSFLWSFLGWALVSLGAVVLMLFIVDGLTGT